MTLRILGCHDFPSNWAEVSLGAFKQEAGRTFNPQQRLGDTFELYSVPSHANGVPEIVSAASIGSNKQFVEPGDVLISKINPRLNRTWVVGDFSSHEKIASTEWIVFPRSEIFDPKFLGYLLQIHSIRDYLAHHASGVGGSLTRIRPSLLDSLIIGLPPKLEQHRIVQKIEELFSELDKGIENLKTARAQLRVYRQALLKHALEGKLTAQWRANNPDKLETADTLLERIHHTRVQHYEQQLAEWESNDKQGSKPKEPSLPSPLTADQLTDLPHLPRGWVYVRAEDIAGFITKGTTPSKEHLFQGNGEVPFIKVYNLTKTGFLDFSIDPTFISKDTHNKFLARSKVFPGDVLMNIVGPPLGKVSIVPNTFPEWNINQAIAIFRSPVISNKFLAAYLAHDTTVRAMMRKAKATAGQFNLTLEICRETVIPYCCMQEQKEIELLTEDKLSEIDHLDQTIDTGLQQAGVLRQSILKKAVSGQLVPQDQDDETASALIARIEAEKPTKIQSKKASK